MALTFIQDEWYRRDDGEGVYLCIVGGELGTAILRHWGYPTRAHGWAHVTVRPAKPRRTLTLSRGLAWMHAQKLTGESTLRLGPIGAMHHPDQEWAVFETPSKEFRIIGRGPTPCAAIIAARKSLGVRS